MQRAAHAAHYSLERECADARVLRSEVTSAAAQLQFEACARAAAVRQLRESSEEVVDLWLEYLV